MNIVKTNALLLSCVAILLISCEDHLQRNSIDNQDPKTIAIYLAPMEYDTLVRSVRDKLEYEGMGSTVYLPKGSEINLTFVFTGDLSKYMEHGTMNVIPHDSTVTVRKLSDTSFVFKALNPSKGVISMEYELVLDEPYFFTLKREGNSIVKKYGESIPLFLRSFMVEDASLDSVLSVKN